MFEDRFPTPKEKKTFHIMIQYPELNDREIAEKANLSISTVTAIRKRLSENNFYRTVRVPNFPMLGFELLVVGYGQLPIDSASEGVAKKCYDIISKRDEIFFGIHSKEAVLFISVAENYTEARKLIEHFQNVLEFDSNEKEWRFVMFSFAISKVLNFFDCTNIVEKQFNMSGNSKPSASFINHKEVMRLTSTEKDVLKKLVEAPTKPDIDISSMSGASRQTVAAARKKFESSGLLKTVKIPNIKSLDVEILVFAHSLFNPSSSLIDREKGVKFLLDNVPQFLLVSANYENVLMAATRSYEDFSMWKSEILKLYKRNDFIRGEPNIILMPTKESVIIKDHDYSGIMKIVKARK